MENGIAGCRFDPRDEETFTRILTDHRLSLTFFIQRIVGDPHAAEDLAIDTFLELLLHPKRYDGRSSIKTYLFMIGRSKALNYLKRRSRISAEPLPEDLPDDTTLEEVYLADRRKRALHEALGTLPEDMRTAVHLVYFEAQSYRQAAQIMKKSEKQVDNLLYRAKAALRGKLGKDGLFL